MRTTDPGGTGAPRAKKSSALLPAALSAAGVKPLSWASVSNDDAADSAGLVADQRRHRRPHKHRAARLEDGGDDPRGELRAAADGVVGA